MDPEPTFAKKCSIFQINDSKQPTYIHSTFYLAFYLSPCNNLSFYFFLNEKINRKKERNKSDNFFLLFLEIVPKKVQIFRNCPLKGAQVYSVYVLSALKVFLKRMKQKRPLKVHPPSAGRGPLFFSIVCSRFSFRVSRFLNAEIERQH